MRHPATPSGACHERTPYHRKRKFSARPFYLALLAISALCAYNLVTGRSGTLSNGGETLVTRDISDVFGQDCHLVHRAPDKCAFVKAHCPDEEAGLFSYLTLYYCNLPQVQPFAFIVIALWLCLLFSTIGIAASDFFCVNLSTIASLLGMSESLAGVTFLAFGNGSPDVFSTFAAMGTNSGSLAVGELIGAASFITAVVAGSMAIVRPFKVARKSFVRDVGFFIVAAAFSIVFLRDSKLYLWESAAMVGFYLFYVAFVIFWHWWQGKSRKRRHTEALARDHFVGPGSDVEPVEPYHDDEDLPTNGRPTPSRTTTMTDFIALERGATDWSEEIDADDQEEARERWLGEISSNMRVNRPRVGARRGTLNPIRPSLVGALEFRAVLAGLEKSRNIQSIPINLRRYSDDPTFTSAQQHDQLSTISDPPVRPSYEVIAEYGAQHNPNNQYLDVKGATGHRARAVSANDIDRLDPAMVAHFDHLGPVNEEDRSRQTSHDHGTDGAGPSTPSVQVSLTPPPSEPSSSRAPSIHPPQRSEGPQFLVPPSNEFYGPPSRPRPLNDRSLSPGSIPQLQPESNQRPDPPKLQIPQPPHRQESGASSPLSPFPLFVDDPNTSTRSRASSLRLPPPGESHEALHANGHLQHYEVSRKRLRWWPYRILPPPEVLFSTLFPTLCNWREKNIWERSLGIVAAPSIFCLTITLPIVEIEQKLERESRIPTLTLPSGGSLVANGHPDNRKSTITILEPDSSTIIDTTDPGSTVKSIGAHGTTATVAVSAENLHQHAEHPETLPLLSPSQPRLLDSPEQLPSASSVNDPAGPKEWNRWLLMIQCFTSPVFTMLIFYANFLSDDHGPLLLLKMCLYSLIVGCALLALVLTTSTPTRPPKWRTSLCFVGFIVSIAWISTIANEVVGVLKWLGVVLNMSDAILGLTVFAVGNSLGDFVADVTVARLGFPVMALSACFGGPMLNILLGIGLSGMYMTITRAQKKGEKHPDQPLRLKPFHVDVSGTLLISGATLLITLVCLLIAVPLRKWRMDRVIGMLLIILWVASTATNVVVELLGLSDDIG
ncbi:hypothetical protein NA57DRAFT_39614 [Rhizodiscina lignyota]|uniref:Sodium/calcium exchanger membrane region domain-containing protein n=1 Tax=Rhizodiscina lignyota TaxID=1504668 RepID=A0A9P4II71_9PEZI|nr:hypothetical protein NA57DRAFT_39614 [Rhizodiscina lignyota]